MTRPAGLTEALALAVVAHQGQKNKFNGEPYILHVLRVVERTAHMLGSEDIMIAAALHDVVEDTEIRIADLLRFGFSVEVCRAVDSLTRRENETYLDSIKRAGADPIAQFVKIADLRDHMSTPEPKPGMHQKYKAAYVMLRVTLGV